MAKHSPSTAVSTPDQGVDLLKSMFAGAVEVNTGDPDEISAAMAARILAMDNVEDIFGTDSEVVHARDILNVPLTVHGVTFNEGDFAGGTGVYAVADVSTLSDPDDRFMVTCGGANVCAALLSAKQHGLFPVVGLQFVQAAKATANGYYPLWLKRVPKASNGSRAPGVAAVTVDTPDGKF